MGLEIWKWLTDVLGGAIFWIVLALEVVALVSVPSVLLRRRGRPTAALAWLLALFALPAIGGLAWWAFGRTSLERKRRKRAVKSQVFSELHQAPAAKAETIFDRLVPERALGDCVFPSSGNELTLLVDGHNAFPAMREAIRGAKTNIHALFYTWEDDSTGEDFRNLMMQKAREGVTVRVLVDAFGSSAFASKYVRPLREAGVEVGVFLPSRLFPLTRPRLNFVNHRKILTIDQTTAFTGGMNIAEVYEHEWRDTMIRVHGPGVAAFDHVFLDDWYFATGKGVEALQSEDRAVACPGDTDIAVIASGPDSEAWIHDAYFLSLTQAQKRIWLATPYFIPGPAILAALRTAAGRGLDVRIVVPSTSDVRLIKWASRSYQRMLVVAGVHIYEYQGPMLHAKVLVVDDDRASVGTANIDSRSFRLSFEVGCFCSSRKIADGIAEFHESLVADSLEITEDVIARKPTLHKLAESAAHLLSPML